MLTPKEEEEEERTKERKKEKNRQKERLEDETSVHELSITQNIVAIVAEQAAQLKVIRVKLEIGELSAVVPDAIRFCFDVCSKGTVMEGAVLEIENISARGRCKNCQREFPISLAASTCLCGSRDVQCIAGEELKIKEMETE